MNKKIFWLIGIIIVLGLGGWWFWPKGKTGFLSPEAKWIFQEKPLQKYSFPELRQKVFLPDGIWVEGSTFYFWTEGRKVSGQIKIPSGSLPEGGWPVVIMIRGYADRESYQTGIGTNPAATVFAKNGYLTLAPDFLGYGESDMPPDNTLEDRFLTPVTVLQLIASVKNLKEANPDKIAIWGHSNGGQIALAVLEISGKKYPTSLWAPVSKPFPYSILYYTDEFDDFGKALRKVVAGFDAQYEANEFSIHNYYDWIEAPIQIHQGTADDAVPLEWSQALEKNLKEKGKIVELNIYPGADHNLAGASDSWNLAVQKSLEWFNIY
ncbi:MAG: alpha/beta fold hydrolase [Patescibacteria group bacterium]